MKKNIFIILILFVALSAIDSLSLAQQRSTKKYDFELTLGPRIPLGVTSDDITTGLGLTATFGYRLNRYFEIIHTGIDFGSSSPHNPNYVVIQDYYSYYGRLAMETVSIFGLPLTTRFHFQLKPGLDSYLGAGVAYYWYSSRLEDPVYGQLQEQRKRSGFGPVVETGIVTDFFSEKWLIMLKFDLALIETDGKSLSIRDDVDPDLKTKRTDKYLTISLGMRYLF